LTEVSEVRTASTSRAMTLIALKMEAVTPRKTLNFILAAVRT
jgi:hypothetical protein